MNRTSQVNQLKLLVLLSLMNKINQNEIEQNQLIETEETSNIIEESHIEIEETKLTSKETTKDNTKAENIICNINQRNLCPSVLIRENPCYGKKKGHYKFKNGNAYAYGHDNPNNPHYNDGDEPVDETGLTLLASYQWDEENRLTYTLIPTLDQEIRDKVPLENKQSETWFTYNSSGERKVKFGKISGMEDFYVNNMFQVQNPYGQVTKHIFVGETRIASRVSGFDPLVVDFNDTFYYHPDHLGSTSFVSRADGSEFEQIEYTPYGETWVQEGGSNHKIRYMFTSKELDEETNLYYYGARYYDQQVSRWMSVDPALGSYLPSGSKEENSNLPGQGGVFNLLNLNLYHYAGNNPIFYKDPYGETVEVGIVDMPDYVGGWKQSPIMPRHTVIIITDDKTGKVTRLESLAKNWETGKVPWGTNPSKSWGTLIKPEGAPYSDRGKYDKNGTVEKVSLPEKYLKQFGIDKLDPVKDKMKINTLTQKAQKQWETDIKDLYNKYNNNAPYSPAPLGNDVNSNSMTGSLLRGTGSNYKPKKEATGWFQNLFKKDKQK